MPNETKPEEWEKRFDEKFSKEWNYRHVVNANAIKSFIRETVAQECQKMLAEIEKEFSKLRRRYNNGFDHEYVDTCDVYKMFQKIRRSNTI